MGRMVVQRWLAALWLLDGLLQLKPEMFTKAFLNQVILPTAESQPAWIASSIHWGAELVSPHIGLWNTLFALLQIAFGVLLFVNWKARWVLGASLGWTLLVWWFGEGFGQLMTGQALLLSGAPGAVLVYGLLAIAVWPPLSTVEQASTGGWRHQGIAVARIVLGGLWLLGSGLQFQQSFLTPTGFSQALVVTWASQLVGSHGFMVSMALGVVEFALGLLLMMGVRKTVMVWTSFILSALFWWLGQSFGQILSPLSTDVNTGLLLMLLSVAAYPVAFKWRLRRLLQFHSSPSH